MAVTRYRINKLRMALAHKVADLKEAVEDTRDALNGAYITEEYRRRKATGYDPLRLEVDTILETVKALGLAEEFTPSKCGFDWGGTVL